MHQDRLMNLEAQVKTDLAKIAHPRAPWLAPRTGPDNTPAFDVIVIGAGQSGLAAAFGLMRSQVTNILVLDKAKAGHEGPWRTYARMETLRSPKDFTGPDLDVPSLTYQSWHEARFGQADWQKLTLIPKGHWADYLDWFRHVVDIPVRNETAVVDIAPADGCLAVTILRGGKHDVLYARKVVLATGQEGMGDWAMPEPFASLPAESCAQAAAEIDFSALRGKVVVVVGAGASAFDNAATALEAGAAQVHLLCRRREAQVIQPYRWLTFCGFLRHMGDLDDVWRWRFMSKILDMREGFPQATYDRCAAHANFHLGLGQPVLAANAEGAQVALTTPGGRIIADYTIVATGIDMDFGRRSELQRCAGNIATWTDRYTPPAHERSERLGRFPYLDADYALMERDADVTPWVSNIHLFSIASTMSFGASGSSINAMTTAVPKLVAGVTRGLFKADLVQHWQALVDYNVPQAVLHTMPAASDKSHA